MFHLLFTLHIIFEKSTHIVFLKWWGLTQKWVVELNWVVALKAVSFLLKRKRTGAEG